MDELEQAKIVELLDKVQVLPDASLVFIGVIAFIAMALGFIWVIGKLISLQATQSAINADIQTSQRDLMVESNRQTELMRMAFDTHNGLERQRNQTMEAYSETIGGLQRTFLEKLPQLLEAGEILATISKQQGDLAASDNKMFRELHDAQLELKKLSGQVVMLVEYTEEGKKRQIFVDLATAKLAMAFASLENRIVMALGVAAQEATLPSGDTQSENHLTILPPQDSMDNLTNVGEE